MLLRGDGLVGGPSCGILAGRQDLIGRITSHPLFVAWQLDALRCAALIGTLEFYANSSQGPSSSESLPVWQALASPLENLRNRAERIAPQVAQAADVASATAVETRSPIASALLDGGGWPSVAVALTATNGDIRSLERRLRRGDQPVIGRVENDQLLLDLRTVIPRQDTALVQAICGGTTSDSVVDNRDNPIASA
jgi:L-seryl-tRNA(Ser) seleniumtransferase